MNNIIRIRSGGQSGVDRAALDFARYHNIPICGWCPKDGWAEDSNEPPGLLDDYPELVETPDTNVAQRTMWNVRDADATLIFVDSESPGTNLTIETAERLQKPHYVSNFSDEADVCKWIRDLPMGTELNIGGPRESESPGIYKTTYDFLEGVFFK